MIAPIVRRARTAALLATAAVVASPVRGVAQAPAAAAANGWRFTWTTTSRAEGGRRPGAPPATTLSMAVVLAGGRARIDEANGRAPGLQGPPPGGWMLLDARGPARLVDPAEKKVLVLDAEAAAGMAPPGITAQVDSVRVDATPLGAGETLLGRPTRKWRIVQSYVMRMSMGAQSRTFRSHTETEAEVSPELERSDAGFAAFGARFGRGLQQDAPLPGLAPLAAATKAKWPAGVVLRMTQRSTTISGTDTLRVTTEGRMTALSRAAVTPASLDVPTGYETIEASRLMQQRRPAPPAPAPARRP